MSRVVKFDKLFEWAMEPRKDTPLSAGFTVFSAENATLQGKWRRSIRTGIELELPEGYHARLAPHSRVAQEKLVLLGATIIDRDYRGGIKVQLYNWSEANLEIRRGDPLAQILFEKTETVTLMFAPVAGAGLQDIILA